VMGPAATQIEGVVVRRPAAIVFSDAVGYARMVGRDQDSTLALVRRHHDALFRLVAEHGGRVVNNRGDGTLLEFPASLQALACAVAFQEAVQRHNAGLPADRRISFRVGVHFGEIVLDPDTIVGDSVNIAARLEQLAEPGAINVSDQVRAEVSGRLPIEFVDLGIREMKNIRHPVHVWRVALDTDRHQPAAVAGRSGGDAAWAGEEVATTMTGDKPAIAVLPFTSLNDDKDQEYFADGVAEDIVTRLTRSPWLFVVASNSSFQYRGANLDSKLVCGELGVRYLVQGSVRRRGAKLRVAAQLIDGVTGESLWAERYDRALDDIFDVQDEIATTVVATIEPVFLRREEERSVRAGPRDLQHWDLIMRARWHFWRTSRQHNRDAQQLLEQALALRPDHATTLALLAFSYFVEVWSGWAKSPKDTIAEAHRLAMKAVKIDDGDSYAHFTLGTAISCLGRLDLAIAEQRRALDLHPTFAAAAGELGRYLAFSGQCDEALVQARRALAASPRDPHASLWLRTMALACFVAGRRPEAVQHAADAVAKRPDWFFNHYLLAACHAEAGDIVQARVALAEGQRQIPDYSLPTLKIGHPFVDQRHLDRFVGALRTAGWPG